MIIGKQLAFATALALVMTCPVARAQDAPAPTQTNQLCLDQTERRAEIESGRLVHLSAAMRAAKARIPGTVVRARLCQGEDGLVYVLTVLARDGKVARIAVDAVKGTLVGGL
jgi:uncharacterized membrane protein YkoI